MKRLNSEGVLGRLIEMLLPAGGGLVVMHVGYFDESGDLDREPGVFCISGYYIASEATQRMDVAWGAVLDEFDIPYFHMVDCAHGAGIFENMDSARRVELVKRLIQLIKEYTLEGFSAICHAEHFAPSDHGPEAYSLGASMCISALRSHLQLNRVDSKIAYFFESSHSSSGRAYNFVAQKLKETGSPLTFAGKTDVRLLQAADLLAWQTPKFVKGRLNNARPPRRDFLSLMEHPHAFAYASVSEDGESTIAFEMWPLSRRSQHTTEWTIADDGPLKHMFEGDDKTPILPVERTLGWRPGAGQMVYLGFRQLGDQEFALAFDGPRLVEAVGAFLSALGAYPNGNLRPILPVHDVRVEASEGGMLIAIRLPQSGELGFYLSEELAKKAAGLLSGAGQS